MHHVPSAPPLSARIRAALRRWVWPSRSASSFRARRVIPAVLVGMVAGVVAVIALAVPVLSGSRAPVSLDSSSSNSADGDSPVVLGEDGRPVAEAPASRQHRAAVASTKAPVARAGAVTGHPTGTASVTDGTSRPRTLPGSTGPAGTSSASSSSSSSVPGSTSSSPSSPSSSSSAPPSSSAPSSSSAAPAPSTDSSDTVLTLVNDARANAGCPALTADTALATAALANSTDMAAQGAPSVIDPTGTAALVAAGEPDADSVVSTWLADATDKATLLDCGLTSAGLGKLHAAGDIWWTLFLS